MTARTEKRCPRCENTKSAQEFYSCPSTHDGLSGYCSACTREKNNLWEKSRTPEQREARRTRERERARRRAATDPNYRQKQRDWYIENREHQRDRTLVAKYGIGQQDYEAILAAQGGTCALCPISPGDRALHVDHCHQTGRVRGLLCQSCNTSLGKLGDTPEALRRVLDYLEGTP